MPTETKSLRAALYKPTASLSGNEPPNVFRGQNFILRGAVDNPYFEVFAGNLDLSENYDLDTANFKLTAGTIAFTANSTTVTGTSTVFTTDLHIGQHVLAGTQVLHVKSIVSDTVFICSRAPDTSESGLTAYRLPQMFEIDGKRGVVLTGSVIPTSLGHKIGVGSGTFYQNGAALAGTSLVLSSNAKAAIFRPATNDYIVQTLGFAGVPPKPTVNVVAGGTKKMTDLNKHSFMISYWTGKPEGTNGYSNPCEVIKLDGSGNPIQINGAANQFEFDFTASLVGMPSNAKGFIIWCSEGGKATKSVSDGTVTTTSPNETHYDTGPWYRYIEPVPIYSTTFVEGDVHVANNTIAKTAHPFATGDAVYLSSTTTLPAPLVINTRYYVIKQTADLIKLATTKANALAGTAIDLTDDGTGTHTIGYLDTGDLYRFDYLDNDLYGEVSGDNFPPPHAEFVCKIEGKPTYVSCFGPRTVTKETGGNPGNAVVVSKENNVDGAPPEWAAYLTGTIVGWFEGVGRWFMMTASSLDFVVSTGLFGQNSQGGADVQLPIISRPYWKTGAANRYSIIIVDDTLYGRSGGKFFKSVGNGDENVKKYDFGSVVADVTRDWNDGYVLAANDSKNTQIAFFHAAASKNASGYWTTEILLYSLFNDAWLPKIVLTSTTRDMIVSGVATVDEQLEFVCGGRVSGGTFQSKTYRFAAGTGEAMSAYLIWQISDDGMENVSKQIHSIRPTGKFKLPTVQVHGARPGGTISVADMEAGTNSLSGDISFAESSAVTRYLEKPVKIKNLGAYALRIATAYDGAGIKDRLDELVVEISTHGRPR